MVRAVAFACANCRISPGHHKYFSSSSSAEGYFSGKKKIDFGQVTIVRSPESKHGYNVGSCHVQEPLSALENCDYFCFKNSTSSVMFINRIISVEYVNENSSRIHYSIDHYATYIGYINLGWAFVERTHVPDYTDVTKYMLPEPINVPKIVTNSLTPVISAYWQQLHSDMCYAVYMTSDEKGNANSPDVKMHNICGAPFYGRFMALTDPGFVDTIMKSYLNQTGYLVNAVNPTVSNICKIVYCPKTLTDEGDALKEPLAEVITFPTQKFLKALTPQFLKAKLVALSTGATIELDATKATYATSSIMAFGFMVRGCGGTSPVVGMTTTVPITGIDIGPIPAPNPDAAFINVLQLTYPELPIATFMPSQSTVTSYGKETFKGAVRGAVGGAVMAAKKGGIGGGIAGAVEGALGAASVEENTQSNYVFNSSPQSQYAVAQGLYSWQMAVELPTSEGFAILESFFNSFGYNVSRRQQLNLAVRGNFTYIKTSGGITATSDTAPQYSIDQIGLMFDQGLTVWSAEIGSTESCG